MPGLSIMLGLPDEEGGGDTERDAALAAVKRFRSAKSDEEALEAFEALCSYAKAASAPADDEGS